ncbi:peptide chain release factor-like protein [Teredinibacter sp. KSP-S5-2]|uniref:peptide chain release factor-like protein n=1 Tax=Teredinibacter sp. KSP-S5-2 TaxID=3034506 RepID=UPI00293500C9|nr:peptide chain release factor-like protein [Teredinibacter sp. KSP-S5-2]WNO10887.1 peptide chain release factor-like protein [Teredinibacter sp. KSP-S5-2]
MLQEAGGHRIQRIPPTEKRGRVHTSSVTVAVYDASIKRDLEELSNQDVRIEWFSGTGAGGQHRNKTQNCCRVIHTSTGMVESHQGRNRETNKKLALEALERRLFNAAKASQNMDINTIRTEQIGIGLRGEKIRTYRQKDNLVINHVNGKTTRYTSIMKGNFNKLWE